MDWAAVLGGALGDGEAGQRGVKGAFEIMGAFAVLLDAFNEVRDHGGERMPIDIARLLDARVQREEVRLSLGQWGQAPCPN